MNTNMSPLQLRLLDMLEWFHKFCQEHNLRYYAIGGTMLGAARHQGFIPWDDDIDVGMPTQDYLKLQQLLAGQQKEAYRLEIPGENSDFFYPFSKLYDTTTTLVENTALHIKRGIYIDIFSLDGIGNTLAEAQRIFRSINFKNNLLLARTTGIRKGRSFLKNLSVKLTHAIPNCILNNQKLLLSLVSQLKQRDFAHYTYVGNLVGNVRQREIMPREFFGTPVLYPFEDTQIYGVEQVDNFLTHIYGNWRQFPPIEKQKTHHDFIEFNLQKSYLSKEESTHRK